jgi:protease I
MSVAAILGKREKPRLSRRRAESVVAECLQGLKIALLAADGVRQIELEAPGEAMRRAGAQTQLLSLEAGQIESLDEDLDPGRRYTVDQTVANATVDQYDALLLVPGLLKPDQLSNDDTVVSFVRDFITFGKPVGIVCRGGWTLLESGVARGRSLATYLTIPTLRKTGAAILDGELVSPQDLRAFYSTIAEELTSLFPPVVPASAEQTEHTWAAGRVAKAATLRPVQRGNKYGRLIGGLTYHVR